MRDEADTQPHELPPPVATPPTHHVARPRYFGLTPRGVVVALAASALVCAVIALASGALAVGLLLLAAAVLLAALYLEQAKRSRESSLDRVAAAAADHTKALAGFAGASVRAWTAAGRRVARLRLEASTLARQRTQLQYALGGACFDGDARRVADLREQMRACQARIDECAEEARKVVERARERTSRERLAVASTEVRGAVRVGDPGFEPGTSALSERRSNQLS